MAGLCDMLRARRKRATAARMPIAQARFVMVDVETSGLDLRRDRLLSIGAVAVTGGAIRPADSMAIVLRQAAESDHDNILVHGIGAEQQRAGLPLAEAMCLFSAFVGADTLVAYPADFDRHFLEREHRRALGAAPHWTWIDAAWLAPALLDGALGHRQSLDALCAAYAISHLARHHAVSDAFATAELFLILLARAARNGIQTVGELRDCAQAERQLERLKPPS